jgi:TPR repeat protein
MPVTKKLIFGALLLLCLTGCATCKNKYGSGECADLSPSAGEHYEQQMPRLQKAAESGGIEEKITYTNALSDYGAYWYMKSLAEKADYYDNAITWFEKAIAQKNAAASGGNIAQSYLAEMHLEGRGVKQNYSKAAKLYKTSMKGFNKQAEIYEGGIGVEKNMDMANQCYAEARSAEVKMRAAFAKASGENK